MRRAIRFLLALVAIATPSLHAQVAMGPLPPVARSSPASTGVRIDETRPDRERGATLEFFGIAVGAASLGDGPGSVATWRGGWQAHVQVLASPVFAADLTVRTEATFYDFGGTASPVPKVADPFNDVYETSLAGRVRFDCGPCELRVGGQVGLAGEDRAALGDALYWGGCTSVRYRAHEDLALVAGVAAVSRFEDSAWILPYVGFEWQASERLRIATEAARIDVDFALTDSLSVGLMASYDFRQYRLNRGGPLRGGAFRDEEIRAGVTLGWQPSPHTGLELQVGRHLWREMTFFDRASGSAFEAEPDSPFFAQLTFHVDF